MSFVTNVSGLSYVETVLFKAETMQYWMDNVVTLCDR